MRLALCAGMMVLGLLVGCGPQVAPAPIEDTTAPRETAANDDLQERWEDAMRVQVTDGTNQVIFQLNEGSAAKSLYDQLPLQVAVENYGSNEKIFYPSEGLDTSDVVEGGGPAGAMAYFSPWGNVVMYYGPFGSYPGLYLMGEAVEGAEHIQALSGTLTITAV